MPRTPDALSDNSMFKFLRKSLLYIVLAPFAIMGLGTVSNQAVLYTNNDTFPVRINPVKTLDWSNEGKLIKFVPAIPGILPHGAVFINDNMHVVMTPQTHLNWLADIIDFHSHIYSIGDFAIELGDWLNGFAFYVWAGALLRKIAVE
jgi:hypothetical protein